MASGLQNVGQLPELPSLPTLPALPVLPGSKPKFDSSDGLYRAAVDSGLQKQADDIVKVHSGEQHKQFFSGGFISDVFDVLNVASYGTVGLIKGDGFMKGIENRESFSDDDALGQYGLTGKIGGIILDIATDPFTYIAPWTLLRKVPGIAKAGKAVEEATIGQRVIKDIEGTGKRFETREGGFGVTINDKRIEPFKAVADKVHWMFGADPVFRETYERGMRNLGVEVAGVSTMIKDLGKLEPDMAKNLLVRDETGRFARQNIDELQRSMTPEQFAKVKPIWDKIDSLGEELVGLGVLGKSKFEENLGSYIKNAYREYEVAKNRTPFSAKKHGVKGSKARVEELTEEKMKELGQIDVPEYLLFKTMLDMVKDVEDAKLFRAVSDNFATNVEQPGFRKLSSGQRFQTSQGKVAELATRVKKTNEDLKPLLKELKSSLKADSTLGRQIDSLERELASLGTKRAEELTKFFQDGVVTTKTTKTARKLGTIPEKLQPLANAVKKYETYDDMFRSADGIQLEKAYLFGDLERNGYRSMEQFFDTVKKPFKEATEKTGESVIEGDMAKVISIQKSIEALAQKSELLTDIDRKSVANSLIHLESKISDLRFKKEDLLEEIQINKMGDLAGKYLPDNMANYVDELVSAGTPFGSRLVGEFKFMKVVFNPATHVRNIMSNATLNYWKLGIGPQDAGYYAKAIKSIKNKDEWYQRAQKVGLGGSTYAANELRGLLDDPAARQLLSQYGGQWGKVKNILGDIYQEEENWAKLAAFRHAVEKKGLGDEEAWKVAESATFNYAQVTPFIRKMRTAIWGVPFITFPLKATPIAAEAMLKKTHRVSFFGKLKNAIEGEDEETKRERASEPHYIRDGFYVKLPMKDSEGRSAYFDLTYVIPFGDLLSGQLFESDVSRETGIKETRVDTLLSKNPAYNLIREVNRNQDFYGNRIWRDSDPEGKRIADLTNHIIKFMAPPWAADQLPAGYDDKGEPVNRGFLRAGEAAPDNQRRTVYQELLKSVGLKVQPVSAESQEYINELNKKRALQRLLRDQGVVSEFSRVYQPK